MSAFVLGERRRDVRTSGLEMPEGFAVAVSGQRPVEVIDASAGGVRIRGMAALRPGRVVAVRVREHAAAVERPKSAVVARCSVYRLGRLGVTYEAGLMWDVEAGRRSL